MMTATVILLFGLLYTALVLRVHGLLNKRENGKEWEPRPFSVIVAARNEGARVMPLIASLEKLDYPFDKREILFVNDASTDDTGRLLEEAAARLPGARCMHITPEERTANGGGKKNALHRAIMEATGAFIAVTDADCVVPRRWLKAFNTAFDAQTVMVLGHGRIIPERGFLNRLLRFDNLFAGLVSAIPAFFGAPVSSVGRSMAYRRAAYLQSGGYPALKKHGSGDDVFLTERFRKLALGGIRFCRDEAAYVLTRPPERLSEIFWQQVRKNSKLLHKSAPSWVLTLFLLTVHALLVYGLLNASTRWMTGMLWGVKWLTEWVALRRAAVFFGERDLIPWLPFFEVFYPVYMTFFALLGTLGIYKWKT